MSDGGLEGLLFDGRTAAAVPVRVEIAGGVVRVAGPAGETLVEAPLALVRVSDAFASAPRQLTFEDGRVVEVTDGAALTARLAAAGRRPGLVDRLQRRWPAAVAALAISAALLALGYLHGLPAAARAGAALLPARLERRLGEGVLEVLDGGFLEPSRLSPAEQASATARVEAAARRGAPGLEFRLLFRGGRQRPDVNAFALPGGTVVVLDGLVRRTGPDDRLVAVVAHELGHLAHRHPTQRLIQAGGLGAAAGLLWGDFSSTLASVPTVLALLDYSRDAEREADEEALRFLGAAGADPRALFDAFCLLEAVERRAGLDGLPRLLSTHPAMAGRLAAARGAAGAAWSCPPAGGPDAGTSPRDEDDACEGAARAEPSGDGPEE